MGGSFEYRKSKIVDGHFDLLDENKEVITTVDSIWLIVDVDSKDIHRSFIQKHGSKENIQKRYDEMQTELRVKVLGDVGREMADELVMMEVTRIPLEEINHALAAMNYIARIMLKYDLMP